MPYYPDRKTESPDEEKKQGKLTEKQIRILRRAAVVLFCIFIIYGAVRLILYYADLNASRNTSLELSRIYYEEPQETQEPVATEAPETPLPSPDVTPESREPANAPEKDPDILEPVSYPDNPELKVSEQFRKLRKKGKYIIGWLSFDEVDEAVVQKDNEYFLNHDAAGKKNSNGAIFLDSGISLKTRPYTVVLYGHNMKTGKMVGRLKKYRENAYFYRNRIITFDTMYEKGQYAVFAVTDISTTPGTAQWYDIWSLNTDSRTGRETAIRALERRSAVSNVLDVQADDQILLLVTCVDSDSERLVVAARRLREKETPDSLDIR